MENREKETLHFISHTHWDREWFMSFERFRMRLVELMDRLLDTLDNNPDFRSFHMDGQIIPILDYLEIKPHMEDKVRRYIQEGRIIVGPWYILQDAYLISGESNIRNMLIGLRESRKFGEPVMLGYYPDTFGNISQTAQILQGFGVDNAVFGRGLGSVAAANGLDNAKEQLHSEILWEAPDGSRVIGIYLANWYHNAMEIPKEKEAAVRRITEARDNARKFALTPHLLMMNGCDHEPVQVDLPQILQQAAADMEGDVLVHSNFRDYIAAVRPYKDTFPVYKGELYGQYSNGAYMLLNTASSRMYLKQANHISQLLLEKWAEPVGVMSWLNGDVYRQDYLYKAWKILLENHPHDSICGCSGDMVADDMVYRYRRVTDIAEELVAREKKALCAKIDTTAAPDGASALVACNPLLWDAADTVSAVLDFPEDMPVKAEDIRIVDNKGRVLPARVKTLGRTFRYILPDDAFRQFVFVNSFQVDFMAKDLCGLGYSTFYAVQAADKEMPSDLSYGETYAENSHIRIDFHQDGSFALTDKENGRVYDRCNILEDSGDAGEEYNYVPAKNNQILLSTAFSPKLERVAADPFGVTFKVSVEMVIPKGVTDQHNAAVSERTKETCPLKMETYVTLRTDSRRVDIHTDMHNQAENHRIRALFEPGVAADMSYADGHFDILERRNRPYPCYQNPSNCNRQQAFFELHDGEKGMLVANRGLPEYEILPDQGNTMALTLLRCTGQIGDWGDFQTPGAQCIGDTGVDYAVTVFSGEEGREAAYQEGYQFNLLPFAVQQTDIHKGELPPCRHVVKSDNSRVMMSALKKCEERDSVILRMYNRTDDDQSVALDTAFCYNEIYMVNLNEERQQKLDRPVLTLGPKKIVTLEFTLEELK